MRKAALAVTPQPAVITQTDTTYSVRQTNPRGDIIGKLHFVCGVARTDASFRYAEYEAPVWAEEDGRTSSLSITDATGDIQTVSVYATSNGIKVVKKSETQPLQEEHYSLDSPNVIRLRIGTLTDALITYIVWPNPCCWLNTGLRTL